MLNKTGSWVIGGVLLALAILLSCNSDHSANPRPKAVEPLLRLAIGTYWVYADSVWDSTGVTARIDTATVIDSLRDSLGLRWFLSEDVPWLHSQIIQRADTICTLEVGPGGTVRVAQFWPPRDTAYDYDIVVGDFVRRRHVQWLDSTFHTSDDSFDSCITYRYETPTYQINTQILAKGIGFVYAEIIPDTALTASQFVRRTWLVTYRLAQ